MGIYVGPFVRVKVPVAKVSHFQPWCPKCDKRQVDVNFCPDCGTELTLQESKVKEPSPSWTLPSTCVLRYAVTEWGRNEDHAHYVYTIGNGRTDFNEVQKDERQLKRFWFGTNWLDGRGSTDLQDTVFKEEIAWMRARCKEEIESLCRVFGEENVVFGWGIVTGWR